MIFVAGIAEMIHPVKIVVHRVIHAVRAVKLQRDHRAAEKIQEHGVIGAAADAGIYEIVVLRGLRVFFFAVLRGSGF